MAKTLILDIETSPIEAYVWQTQVFKARITPDKIIRDTRIISFGARWLGNKGFIYKDIRGRINDAGERVLLGELWDLFDRADIIVAHNGQAFDFPTILAKFAAFDFPPPRPAHLFDTYREAKKYFKFTSNKLEFLARSLGCPIKKSTHAKFPGMELWAECLKDNLVAWKEMRAYNLTDVEVLEWVYDKRFKVWSPTHPNVANINGTNGCPKCGKQALKKVATWYTHSRQYTVYRCKCGSIVRGQTAVRGLDNKVIKWSPQ